MDHEQWHYEWVKVLVQEGVPVETAQTAFKVWCGKANSVDTTSDPVLSARDYLESKAALAVDATV
jgi:hypothetical protein